MWLRSEGGGPFGDKIVIHSIECAAAFTAGRRDRAGAARHMPLATDEIDRQTPTRTPTHIT